MMRIYVYAIYIAFHVNKHNENICNMQSIAFHKYQITILHFVTLNSSNAYKNALKFVYNYFLHVYVLYL